MKFIFTFLFATAAYLSAVSQCSDIAPGFTDSIAGNTVYFYDQTTTDNGWSIEDRHWDYGDGTMYDSVVLNPIHVFAAPGVYNVTLTIYGLLAGDSTNQLHCQQQVSHPVNVVQTGIATLDNQGVIIYPNPSNGYIQIKATVPVKAVYIYNLTGQLLAQANNATGYIELPDNTNQNAYFVRVETPAGTIVRKILMLN